MTKTPPALPQTLFNLSPKEVLAVLKTSRNGLNPAEVRRRLARFGLNEPMAKRQRHPLLEVVLRFTNPLSGILLVAALISAITGNLIDATIITVMVLLSVALDYFQSHRSLQAAERLKTGIAMTATVMKDGRPMEVLREELVPGDIIQLTAGDMVPADALLLDAKDFHVQQASLTGESLPVEKAPSASGIEARSLAEAINAVCLGSAVVSGTATAVVITTGPATVFGQIAKQLALRPPRTEFDKGILEFGLFITRTILFLLLFIFTMSALLKHDMLESLLFAVALAVGLTPEFLPMITTVTLANGAMRMARENVIVKNLAAIQNFGSIDILCSDKTGTLTRGQMSLEEHLNPVGQSSERVLLLAYLNSYFNTGIDHPTDAAILSKANINPLDAAILLHGHPDIHPYRKVDEVPFDFERRRVSLVVENNGEHLLITKGAPESILSVCTSYEMNEQPVPLSAEVVAQCGQLFRDYSEQGYRLLAVAYRKLKPQGPYHIEHEMQMTLAGFLVFADPPLPDAAKVLEELREEGVNVKILTGDNDLVARHVCRQIGLDPGEIILGDDIDRMSDPALAYTAERTQIFARVSPAQKNRIIHALRSRGHVVGYIGDGINDAPSLHTADVGISVTGATDVAREAADIILHQANLTVLLAGIIEGRKAFGNVMKYLMMGTSSNFGNMFSMAGAILFLPFLPMTPVQILLNNLLYDLAQVTIPSDRVDEQFTRKPRHWDIAIIRRFMLYIGPISSLYDFLTFFVMLKVFHASEKMFHTGWFVESLATQTLVIFIIRTAGNPLRSRPSPLLMLTTLSIVVFGIVLPYLPFAHYLGFVPLPLPYFLFLSSAVLTYLLLVELVKRRVMLRWFGS